MIIIFKYINIQYGYIYIYRETGFIQFYDFIYIKNYYL